jgi:CspA family cold shock protein
MKGTVKWFSNRLGYGFIAPDDGSRECFVHYSGIEGQSGFRTLSPGDKVRFTMADNGRGPQARQVRRIGLVDDGLPPLTPGEGVAAVQKVAARSTAQWIDWQVYSK